MVDDVGSHRSGRRFPALLGAAALAVALSSIVAGAQPVATDVAIRAVVPKYCTSAGNLGPIDIALTIEIGVDGMATTDMPAATRPAVVCNTAADVHAVSLRGGARGAASTPLNWRVNWRASVSFGSASLTLDTASAVSATTATTGPINGALAVTFAVQRPEPALPPGIYRDVVRIRLVPR